jgi:cyclophilin family peptidyl-prolyl cis-trans isomerase
MRMLPVSVLCVLGAAALAAADEPATPANPQEPKSMPVVLIETSHGTITAELFEDKAPLTVANFLAYADKGAYDGTIFHRVIDGFMIQGGGFTPDMAQKKTDAPIKNEARADVPNARGTLAMARTMVVDSATCQFFINLKDNAFLNHTAPTPQGYGYAVFGRVTDGLDVVDKIAKVATGTHPAGHKDVPSEAVVIRSIKRAP